MALPHGVCKSAGLREALRAFRLSPRNALAIGDAENDHDLLEACEVGAAVAWGSQALVAGDPRSGKSWAAGLVSEQLLVLGYSLCIVDPETRAIPASARPWRRSRDGSRRSERERRGGL